MKLNTITEQNKVREIVRLNYGKAATGEPNGSGVGCCANERPSCTSADKLGYSSEEIAALPEGADLGLGCGNPQAIASLKPGETVLDLGSGAGFDCFLASRSVGPTGRVIGVDMTPEMIAKAQRNADKTGATNVEFRLGQIESLPLGDKTVDVVISNCVINLSPDKPSVFQEAFRVLKPGGRLAVADIVRTAQLPTQLQTDMAALCGCVAGAATIDELQSMLQTAGFHSILVAPKDASREFIRNWIPGRNAEDYVVSATIEAIKPASACCGPGCCS